MCVVLWFGVDAQWHSVTRCVGLGRGVLIVLETADVLRFVCTLFTTTDELLIFSTYRLTTLQWTRNCMIVVLFTDHKE